MRLGKNDLLYLISMCLCCNAVYSQVLIQGITCRLKCDSQTSSDCDQLVQLPPQCANLEGYQNKTHPGKPESVSLTQLWNVTSKRYELSLVITPPDDSSSYDLTGFSLKFSFTRPLGPTSCFLLNLTIPITVQNKHGRDFIVTCETANTGTTLVAVVTSLPRSGSVNDKFKRESVILPAQKVRTSCDQHSPKLIYTLHDPETNDISFVTPNKTADLSYTVRLLQGDYNVLAGKVDLGPGKYTGVFKNVEPHHTYEIRVNYTGCPTSFTKKRFTFTPAGTKVEYDHILVWHVCDSFQGSATPVGHDPEYSTYDIYASGQSSELGDRTDDVYTTSIPRAERSSSWEVILAVCLPLVFVAFSVVAVYFLCKRGSRFYNKFCVKNQNDGERGIVHNVNIIENPDNGPGGVGNNHVPRPVNPDGIQRPARPLSAHYLNGHDGIDFNELDISLGGDPKGVSGKPANRPLVHENLRGQPKLDNGASYENQLHGQFGEPGYKKDYAVNHGKTDDKSIKSGKNHIQMDSLEGIKIHAKRMPGNGESMISKSSVGSLKSSVGARNSSVAAQSSVEAQNSSVAAQKSSIAAHNDNQNALKCCVPNSDEKNPQNEKRITKASGESQPKENSTENNASGVIFMRYNAPENITMNPEAITQTFEHRGKEELLPLRVSALQSPESDENNMPNFDIDKLLTRDFDNNTSSASHAFDSTESYTDDISSDANSARSMLSH